jgi:DNA-binding FrmR family transcriptional regulator
MSTSSEFAPDDADGISGSSAMPHVGQEPMVVTNLRMHGASIDRSGGRGCLRGRGENSRRRQILVRRRLEFRRTAGAAEIIGVVPMLDAMLCRLHVYRHAVVTQVSPIRAALAPVEDEIIRDHVGHCVEHAIMSGDKTEQPRKLFELVDALERMGR